MTPTLQALITASESKTTRILEKAEGVSAREIVGMMDALCAVKDWYENQEDSAPVDAGCIECTAGTVPNNLNTGLCAFHKVYRAIKRVS